MWPCGSDFQYQNADPWFRNLDKIIHYVNQNASRGGPIKAMYSTPTVRLLRHPLSLHGGLESLLESLRSRTLDPPSNLRASNGSHHDSHHPFQLSPCFVSVSPRAT